MNSPRISHISYRLREYVEMCEDNDRIIVCSSYFQITISSLSTVLRSVMMTLSQRTCSVCWMNETIASTHDEGMVNLFYRYIARLIRHQMVDMVVEGDGGDGGQGTVATLMPISSYFQHRWAVIQPHQQYVISRFAYERRERDGQNYLESPLSHACLCIDAPIAANVIYHLRRAVSPQELFQVIPEEDCEQIMGILELLLIGNFVSSIKSDGKSAEDEDKTFMQWDFHDLLFHSRSRKGRHSNAVGGTYRFYAQIPPQPAVKRGAWSKTIALPQPDMENVRANDPGLSTVMDKRSSIRTYGQRPMTIEQLSEFLYRVARIEEVHPYDEIGDKTKRPYPDGGASYEMEVYLTIDRCEGLAAGFYWYDPLLHSLSFIQGPGEGTERLLQDASNAIGVSERPQILLNIAARFQRVSWKYESIAYALILKHVGVMYATMYLVATAMDLAPCALGLGDSDLFAQLAGQEYLQETSVGEFVLGSKAEAPLQ